MSVQYIQFLASNSRFLAFGFVMALASTFGQTFYIAMFSGEIRNEFGLSHGDFGTLYAIGTVTSGLLIIWVGRIIDIVDLRLYAVVLCAAIATACLALSLAEGVIMLTVAIFLLRLAGQGLLSQAATVSMARYFTENARGRAVSIAALGFPSGQALFPVASVLLRDTGTMPWRDIWMFSAAALIVLLAPILLVLLKGHGARHVAFLERAGAARGRLSGAAQRQWTRLQVLRDSRFILAMPALLAPAFIVTGLNLHQVHLVESKGWALSLYASSFVIYSVCQVGMSVVTGILVDRVGAIRLTPYYMLPLAAATFVIAGFDAPLTVVAFMALAGISGGAGAIIIATVWAELYGVLHLGGIKAMVAGLQVISSALGPAVFGWLIDEGVDVETVSAASGVYAVSGCLLLAMLFRPRRLRIFR